MVVFKLDSDETAQILVRGPKAKKKQRRRKTRRKETDDKKYNEEENKTERRIKKKRIFYEFCTYWTMIIFSHYVLSFQRLVVKKSIEDKYLRILILNAVQNLH